MTEKKQRKAGKRLDQRRNELTCIIATFPVLKGTFEIDYPEIQVDDILGCNPNSMLLVYDFFLRTLSLPSFADLYDSDQQNALMLKNDPYSKSLSESIHKVRFYFVVRELNRLLNGPILVLEDLSHPELPRTVMFFKKILSFIQFYCKECFKYEDEKNEENSLRGGVGMLRKEEEELQERDDMLDAKIRMEEVAKGRLLEDIMTINSDNELCKRKIHSAKNELLESDKDILIAQDRINEAKLFLLDVQRKTENQSNEIVTSPDQLLKQKIASENLIEVLITDLRSLETEVLNRKKNIGTYDGNIREIENLYQCCSEIKPLIHLKGNEKQTFNELVLRKEEKQMKVESLILDTTQFSKHLKALRDRYDRISSVSKQQLLEESTSKLPDETEFLKGELESNLDSTEDLKEDINSLNEVMNDYRISHKEQKGKLITTREEFVEFYNKFREELGNDLQKLDEYFLGEKVDG